MAGPLKNLRVVEMGGIGPVPFAGMMLGDHGAEVIRVDRPGGANVGVMTDEGKDVLSRSRLSIVLDLKRPEAVAAVRDLCRGADILIEGFRPGVMERLGLGPDILLRDNPRLIYGRMTGWGQDGPLAGRAGHDINYIAIAGNLHTYGRAGAKPTPPINAVGDFGGGMLFLFGLLAAVFSARETGHGQVVDCAMTDGAGLMASMVWALRAQGLWTDERGTNLLDTGAPFYDTYETADGLFVAVGAIEPAFLRELLRLVEVEEEPDFTAHLDARHWPRMRERLTSLFKSRTRAEWEDLFDGHDACVTPVLSMAEAPYHPHNVQRGAFFEANGAVQPSPAPRFAATPSDRPVPPRPLGADGPAILRGLGYDEARIASLCPAAKAGGE